MTAVAVFALLTPFSFSHDVSYNDDLKEAIKTMLPIDLRGHVKNQNVCF